MEYYTISAERLGQIAQAADVDEATAREHLLADWPEGAEHQAWIDTAPVAEIADWLKAQASAR